MVQALLAKIGIDGAQKIASSANDTIKTISQAKTSRIEAIRGWAGYVIYFICAVPFAIVLYSMVIDLPFETKDGFVEIIGQENFFRVIMVHLIVTGKQ